MNKILITVLVLAGLLAVACQASKEFFCEFKSDGIFENNTEKRLLQLRDLQFTYFYDCEDALDKGFTKSGVYRIKPGSFRPFQVWCDMETQDGGWTVIQTRFDGLIDFYRTWVEYRNGFGSVDSEHWLGNNFIRHITENNDYELLIELTGFLKNEYAFAKYSSFRIGSEDDKYKLYVGQFTGNGVISDSLSVYHGTMFSTKDNDNDAHSGNCAEQYKGAWWYTACYHSNLNGVWMSEERSLSTKGSQTPQNSIGIVFYNAFNTQFYSLKSVEMKVRRRRQNKFLQ